MANLALVTANRVRNASKNYSITDTSTADEAIVAGAPVRLATATGKFTNANGSSAGEARVLGIALHTVAAGEALTILMYGELDGVDIAALAYDAAVYLSDTDGTLADAAGTVSTIVGRVVPAWATTLGTAADKVLRVNCLRI